MRPRRDSKRVLSIFLSGSSHKFLRYASIQASVAGPYIPSITHASIPTELSATWSAYMAWAEFSGRLFTCEKSRFLYSSKMFCISLILGFWISLTLFRIWSCTQVCVRDIFLPFRSIAATSSVLASFSSSVLVFVSHRPTSFHVFSPPISFINSKRPASI